MHHLVVGQCGFCLNDCHAGPVECGAAGGTGHGQGFGRHGVSDSSRLAAAEPRKFTAQRATGGTRCGLCADAASIHCQTALVAEGRRRRGAWGREHVGHDDIGAVGRAAVVDLDGVDRALAQSHRVGAVYFVDQDVQLRCRDRRRGGGGVVVVPGFFCRRSGSNAIDHGATHFRAKWAHPVGHGLLSTGCDGRPVAGQGSAHRTRRYRAARCTAATDSDQADPCRIGRQGIHHLHGLRGRRPGVANGGHESDGCASRYRCGSSGFGSGNVDTRCHFADDAAAVVGLVRVAHILGAHECLVGAIASGRDTGPHHNRDRRLLCRRQIAYVATHVPVGSAPGDGAGALRRRGRLEAASADQTPKRVRHDHVRGGIRPVVLYCDHIGKVFPGFYGCRAGRLGDHAQVGVSGG